MTVEDRTAGATAAGNNLATANQLLERTRHQVVPALKAAVDRLDPPTRLAARYHMGWCDVDATPTDGGGKAIRPALALLSAEAAGAPGDVGIPGAVAVELVHNFSLLHDDLLDGDEERRHRRTVWSIWGAATGILTGDALLALAHEVLLEADSPGVNRAAWLLATVTRELTRGQVQDLAFETRQEVSLDECLDMAGGKTGSLLAASSSIGAVLAGADEAVVAALSTFGAQFGLAFQLVDDVLGIWGDPGVTGKPVYSDLRARKKTLPVAWALGNSRCAPALRDWLAAPDEPDEASLAGAADMLELAGARSWALAAARTRLELAGQALATVPIPAGAQAQMLALAQFVVERDA
jgi:geranylgeranyl diphosphate synthase, type I